MYVTFYKVSDPPNKLIKDITNVIGTSRALAPTGQVNTLNPTIVVAWDGTNGDKVINANYAYIDTFNRYYWITTAIDTANRIVIQGKVDYLMSFAEQIKNCPATIVRAELGKPTYTIDDKLPLDPTRYDTHGINFPKSPITFNNGLITPQYIMITR